MKIIVCIKQVPSTNRIQMDPVTHTIIRDGRQSVINPFDMYAIEEAVRLKEKYGGTVTALSMGIPASERLLRDAVSRGVDETCLLSDRAFAGADTLATSYTLSLGVRHLGTFDLIICGRMATDGDTAQIGPELAETLEIPYVTDVREVLSVMRTAIKVKKTAGNAEQTLETSLPALITVTKDINMPRMSTIAGIKTSLTGHFTSLNAKAISADTARTGLNGSPTQVVKTFMPENSGEAIPVMGDAAAQSTEILKIIRGEF